MDRAGLEDERETLKGIASVLLSLAVLAEFLCLLPLWVRVPVLSLLRPAEAVARAFAIEWVGGGLALPPAASPGPDGDGRIEAMRLPLFSRTGLHLRRLAGFCCRVAAATRRAGRASCATRAGDCVARSRNEDAARTGLLRGGMLRYVVTAVAVRISDQALTC
jgi:hypothetical protein